MTLKVSGVRLAAVLLAALASSVMAGPSDQSREEGIAAGDKAQAMILKHTLLSSREVLIQVSRTLRVRAGLEACNLKSLADSFPPIERQVTQVLLKYADANPEMYPYAFEFDGSVKASMIMYRTGYLDGLRMLLEGMPKAEAAGFCNSITKLANDDLAKSRAVETAAAK